MNRDKDHIRGKGDTNPSRLAKHQAILGFEGKVIPESQLTAERNAIECATPLPLRFPAESKIPHAAPSSKLSGFFSQHIRSWSFAVALAAACLGFLILRPKADEPAWQIKGASSIKVFIEHNGVVSPWKLGASLQGGDRIKAQILASEPTIAYWGVLRQDGKLLTDGNWIVQSRISLRSGEQGYFPGSLQLDRISEGETLIILDCPVTSPDADTIQGSVVEEAMTLPKLPKSLSNCVVTRFPLRVL
jgi:hypothetical protein